MGVLNKLEKVRHQCDIHEGCVNCIFKHKNGRCKVQTISKLLQEKPSEWDMEKISRILGDFD